MTKIQRLCQYLLYLLPESATSTAFILSSIKCLCYYFLSYLVHGGFGIRFPPWLVSSFLFYALVFNEESGADISFFIYAWRLKKGLFYWISNEKLFFIIRSTKHYYSRSLARTQKRFNYSIFLTTIMTFGLC